MKTTALVALALTLAVATPGLAEDFYVAEGGTGTGLSCTSPRSVSWFGTAGNWATPKQAGKIGAGDVVRLCGTISSRFTLQGSGTSGNYIAIDGAGATLATSVTFATNNKSWWIIRNVTWQDGSNDTLFDIGGGSNGIVENARADAMNDAVAFLWQFNSTIRPDQITIRNSYFRTNNTNYGDRQFDMIFSEGATNVTVEGSYLEMRAGGAGATAHDDVIQTWQKGGTNGGPPGNWTIRNNWIVMNSAATNDRSWLMLESLTGTNNIYSNVFLGIQGASEANGISACCNQSGVVFNIFGNTFVAKNGASNNVLNLAGSGTANIRNNIFHLGGQTALTGTMTKNRSNNLWFGSSIPSCSGFTGDVCGTDPMFTNYAANDFSLRSTSPAKGSGTNLGTSYDDGIAPGSAWPNPTVVPRGGVWDKGAFQGSSGSATVPSAPTNLRISSE